jgi:hypothetical protein
MADRAPEKSEAAPQDAPAKKPYAAPVLLQWGTFNELTQTNRHSSARDSSRTQGTN